jgi:uncharacterized protein
MIPLELMLSVNNLIVYSNNFINSNFIFNVTNFPSYQIASSNYPTLLQIFLSILSGIIVGFSLGLVGGGGSILAVPLLVYVIGVDTHVAIGTSALTVAANALINLSYRIGKNCIKIKEGLLFAIPGTLGTFLGAELGLLTPSKNLLVFFALFMIIISILMLKGNRKKNEDGKNVRILVKDMQEGKSQGNGRISDYVEKNIDRKIKYSFLKNMKLYSRSIEKKIYGLQNLSLFSIKSIKRGGVNLDLLLKGFLVGIAAGCFGIGGGFLIVPALIHAIPGLSIFEAIGTSLIPISAFGFLTATKYAFVGQINWFVSLLFIIGGAVGGIIGTRLSAKLPNKILNKIFAVMLILVAIYIIYDFMKSFY